MKPAIHLKITSEILYCGYLFSRSFRCREESGEFISCVEDIDCLAAFYVSMTLNNIVFSEESES